MVDLYEGPSREGTRGGLEQFTWNSIKGQTFRDRECYLGQSVRVGVQGKFGRFSTNDWWIRKREDAKTLNEEKDLLKRFEEEIMQEALGIKPKRLLLVKGELTDSQKCELLAGIPEPPDDTLPLDTSDSTPVDETRRSPLSGRRTFNGARESRKSSSLSRNSATDQQPKQRHNNKDVTGRLATSHRRRLPENPTYSSDLSEVDKDSPLSGKMQHLKYRYRSPRRSAEPSPRRSKLSRSRSPHRYEEPSSRQRNYFRKWEKVSADGVGVRQRFGSPSLPPKAFRSERDQRRSVSPPYNGRRDATSAYDSRIKNHDVRSHNRRSYRSDRHEGQRSSRRFRESGSYE